LTGACTPFWPKPLTCRICLVEWETLAGWNRASISLDWDHLMADYLAELDEYAHHGQMSLDQQVRYQALLRALQAVLPIIERLNFYRPPVALEG